MSNIVIPKVKYYPQNPPKYKVCLASPDGRHRFTGDATACDLCGIGGVVMPDKVLYVPTEKGLEYHANTTPNLLFFGGRGSGKSTAGRWDAHLRAMAHPGFEYVLLRRTYPELMSSHINFIREEMRDLGGTWHATDHIAYYPNGSKGFFRHCANEADVLKLLGSQFALAVFDEISTFDWEMFQKLSSGVRVTTGSGLTAMVRGLTNPFGPSAAQLQQYFVDKDVDPAENPRYIPADWEAIHANLDANPHLDHDQYLARLATLPEYLKKAWIEGKFVAEDQLFDFRPRMNNKPWHVVHELDVARLVKNATIYRAIDVGWHPDPTICLWIAHLGNRFVVFKEMLWTRTIAADIARDIKEMDKMLGIPRVSMTFCDPSMDVNTTADIRTVKDIFEQNGIPMENSINNRELYASSVHSALGTEITLIDGNVVPKVQFYGHPAGCPYLVKSIPQQRFDPKRPLAMADTANDHGVVALAYFLISGLSSDRSSYEASKPRKWMIDKEPKRWVLGNELVRERR